MSAVDFAGAAHEVGKSFDDTLKLLATLQMGGQGQGPAPIAESIARKAPS